MIHLQSRDTTQQSNRSIDLTNDIYIHSIEYVRVCVSQHWEKLYLVMELVQGRDLENILRPKIPLATRIAIAVDVARALRFMHSRNIMHRYERQLATRTPTTTTIFECLCEDTNARTLLLLSNRYNQRMLDGWMDVIRRQLRLQRRR